MKKSLLIILLALVVAGCGKLSPQEQEEAIFYATQNAAYGVVPPPKYQTLAAAEYGLYLTPTPQPTATQNPNWTPTPNAFQYAQTADAQIQANQMTQQALQREYEMQKLKAEQAAIAARETAVVHSANMTAFAQATHVQSTAFAQGTQIMATAYAQATSTERAMMLNAQASSTALVMTQVVAPTNDLLTLQAAKIQQTVEAGEAQKVELAVKRQSAKNYFDAFLPWVLVVALAYVFGRGFQTYVKTRMTSRDEHGQKQGITRELKDGGFVHIEPDMLETGVIKVGPDGDVIRYAPMDKDEQSDLNKRRQFVEGIKALPDSYAQHAPKLLMSGFGQADRPRVNFRADLSLTPVLNEADEELLGGENE
jgi:hypothetical protein